jgi:hypothetical protein
MLKFPFSFPIVWASGPKNEKPILGGGSISVKGGSISSIAGFLAKYPQVDPVGMIRRKHGRR